MHADLADYADVCLANGSALLVHRNRLHRIAFNIFIISCFNLFIFSSAPSVPPARSNHLRPRMVICVICAICVRNKTPIAPHTIFSRSFLHADLADYADVCFANGSAC